MLWIYWLMETYLIDALLLAVALWLIHALIRSASS